ncbi:MAG: hypothetical protein HY900_24515 [Deltaproteobacteria bacterium]|nr:hypothetical protein [Deltaproteobacteria bacterium]
MDEQDKWFFREMLDRFGRNLDEKMDARFDRKLEEQGARFDRKLEEQPARFDRKLDERFAGTLPGSRKSLSSSGRSSSGRWASLPKPCGMTSRSRSRKAGRRSDG